MLRSDGSRTCGGTPGPAPKSGTVRNVKRGCPTRISRRLFAFFVLRTDRYLA